MMICAQLMVFGRVHRLRAEGKEKRRLKQECTNTGKFGSSGKIIERANGHATGPSTATQSSSAANGSIKSTATRSRSTNPEAPNGHLHDPGRDSPDTGEESEVIL